MESLPSLEFLDATPNPDTRRPESMTGTASSSIAEDLYSDIGSFTTTLMNDDTVPTPGHCLRNKGAQPNHPSVTSEERLLSPEMLVSDDTRFAEHAEKRPDSSRLQKLHWWWFWELGGITISVCCMIALLILLPYLDNRPLSDWKFLFAPNTTISTFITVAKTSMLLAVAEGISQLKWHNFKMRMRPLKELDLFDAASRGPWGAFMLMVRMAGKPGALFAMLGSFIVISSLTMEPFAQQILSFEGRRINSTQDVASFSIRRVWDSTPSGKDAKVQQGLESGFMKGLIRSPAGFHFSCSSGNCTWSDFSGLGFCASCEDTTEKTTVNHKTISRFNTSTDSDIPLDGDPDDCVDIMYTTPAGIELKISKGCSYAHRINWDIACNNASIDWKATQTSRGSQASSQVIYSSTTLPSGGSVERRELSSISRQSTSTAVVSSTPSFRQPKIGVIVPPVCLQNLQSLPTSIASNTTYSNFKDGESNSTVAIHAITQTNVTQKGLAGRVAGKAKVTECRIDWCEKIFQNVQVINGAMAPMDVTDRRLTESALKDSIGYLKPWLEGGRLNKSNLPDAWRYVAEQMTFTAAADGNLKFGPASVISEAATVLEVFENIAEAMTHQLYIDDGSIQEPGFAYVQEVFIVVRWKWAVFPMALVLLGLVFLAANLWINSRDGVFLWKSSLLPLLFHGLDGYDAEVLDVNENSEMTETAKQMHARLGKNEAGSTKLIST